MGYRKNHNSIQSRIHFNAGNTSSFIFGYPAQSGGGAIAMPNRYQYGLSGLLVSTPKIGPSPLHGAFDLFTQKFVE